MRIHELFAALALFTLAACSTGQEGDECFDDNDCADGLECHLHEEHDHEEGEKHDHEEGEEHDGEEAGVCEPEGEHDHDHEE